MTVTLNAKGPNPIEFELLDPMVSQIPIEKYGQTLYLQITITGKLVANPEADTPVVRDKKIEGQ